MIETELDASTATVTTRLNGDVKQQAPLTDMIFSVADIIAYASAAFTLLPGDVILTGTPSGVGPFEAGDTVEVEVSGIGVLGSEEHPSDLQSLMRISYAVFC